MTDLGTGFDFHPSPQLSTLHLTQSTQSSIKSFASICTLLRSTLSELSASISSLHTLIVSGSAATKHLRTFDRFIQSSSNIISLFYRFSSFCTSFLTHQCSSPLSFKQIRQLVQCVESFRASLFSNQYSKIDQLITHPPPVLSLSFS